MTTTAVPPTPTADIDQAALEVPSYTRIGLVGCASAKLKRPAPARELYTSALFRKASAYVEATCDRWYILSAKHGLVHPDQVLAPYDVKLGRPTWDPETDGPPVHEWAAGVREQLAVELEGVENPLLVTLAGSQYDLVVFPRSQWPSEQPLKGLMIGERLSWLNKNTPPPARADLT